MKGYVLLTLLLGLCMFLPSLLLPRPGLRILTSSSLYDTGLLEELGKAYEREGGVKVSFLPVGTGQALLQARRGEADLLLTHAPKEELRFLREGWGTRRETVAYNFFLLVGPEGDPAGIRGLSPPEALRRIAETGRKRREIWISRGDLSGTHLKERELWKGAGLEIEDLRGESWYLEAGSGMGATLLLASEKGAYTLTDRGTFLRYRRRDLLRLVPLVEGGKELLNVYSAVPVNPEKIRGANLVEAERFLSFLLSEEGQKKIGSFGLEEYGVSLFFPAVPLLEENSELARWVREAGECWT